MKLTSATITVESETIVEQTIISTTSSILSWTARIVGEFPVEGEDVGAEFVHSNVGRTPQDALAALMLDLDMAGVEL